MKNLTKNITIIREDHHSKNNMRPPWIMQKIIAMDGEAEVGYLKIAYIPKNRAEKLKENPFLFLNFLVGDLKYFKKSLMLNINKKNGNYWLSNLTPKYDKQAELIKEIQKINDIGNFKSDREFVEANKNLVWEYIKEKHSNKIDYHFEKPDVDFIFIDEKYRGRGISRLLYEKGNEWMKEMGMVLYSSTLQEPGAKKNWDRLHDANMVEIYHPKKSKYPRFKFK